MKRLTAERFVCGVDQLHTSSGPRKALNHYIGNGSVVLQDEDKQQAWLKIPPCKFGTVGEAKVFRHKHAPTGVHNFPLEIAASGCGSSNLFRGRWVLLGNLEDLGDLALRNAQATQTLGRTALAVVAERPLSRHLGDAARSRIETRRMHILSQIT